MRGDNIDINDAAYAAWQAGIAEFNAGPKIVTFDENMLSMDNSTNAGDGNDVIVGGDGVYQVRRWSNFVTVKADIDGDGQANLDLIKQISKPPTP